MIETLQTASREFHVETSASIEAIWALWKDVAGWPMWNAGIEAIELHGPFREGSTITMKTPGQDAFTSRLLAVHEPFGFTDETVLGDVRIMVDHHCDAVADERVRITYAISVTGFDADSLCKAISRDFDEVLAALSFHAENKPRPL